MDAARHNHSLPLWDILPLRRWPAPVWQIYRTSFHVLNVGELVHVRGMHLRERWAAEL